MKKASHIYHLLISINLTQIKFSTKNPQEAGFFILLKKSVLFHEIISQLISPPVP